MRGVFAAAHCLPSTWSHRLADLQPNAPDRIRTCDLRFRRPRRQFGGARLGSGFGSMPGLEFVWARLDPVPSVALLLPRQSVPLCIPSGRAPDHPRSQVNPNRCFAWKATVCSCHRTQTSCCLSGNHYSPASLRGRCIPSGADLSPAPSRASTDDSGRSAGSPTTTAERSRGRRALSRRPSSLARGAVASER
jgi:hypothetical protein